jgi:hypothetical protein
LGASLIELLDKARKESAAAPIMSAMRGRVMRSHLRLPIVSILLIAGRAKVKFRKPVERGSETATGGRTVGGLPTKADAEIHRSALIVCEDVEECPWNY